MQVVWTPGENGGRTKAIIDEDGRSKGAAREKED